MLWMPETVVGFDLETTGPDPMDARVVSYAFVWVHAGGEVLRIEQSIVDPGSEISPAAEAVHGISAEQARAEGIPHDVAMDQIVETLGRVWGSGLPVAVYQAPFDLTIVHQQSGRPLEVGPVIDPLVLSRMLPREGSHRLSAVAPDYGVELAAAHDAAEDARATAQLAFPLLEAARRQARDEVGPRRLASIDCLMAIQRARAVDYQRGRSGPGNYVGWPMAGSV